MEEDGNNENSSLLRPAPPHSPEEHKIKASKRGVLLINLTYDVPIFAASYYKLLHSKERVFYRYSSIVSIQPSQSKRIPKSSCTCKHSYGARVFFSSSRDVLQNCIAKDFYERIGSHSISLSHKILVSVEDEILQGYTPHAWRNSTRRVPFLPEQSISVRTPYDRHTNESWEIDISSSEDSYDQNGVFHPDSDDDSFHLYRNENFDSSADHMPSQFEYPSNEQKISPQSEPLSRTSSVPVLPENARVYCPPKRCSISTKEKEIQMTRAKKCKEGLLKYIPQLEDIFARDPSETVPGVALCVSGGSYRSLVASLGAFQGIRDTGLLDCVTYMSCLSGTIWSVGMWYTFPDQDLDNLMENLPSMLENAAHSYLTSSEVWEAYKRLQKQKKDANLPKTRFSDLYATCITKQLLSGCIGSPECYDYPISRLAEMEKLIQGELPIPIFTTIFQEPHNYEWLEITPFETGSDYLSAFVPTNGFGSSFVAGDLTYRQPEVTLGRLFGLSSAVFCLTMHRLWKEIIVAYDLHPLPIEPDTIQNEEKDNQPVTPHRNTITTPRRKTPRTTSHEIPIVNLQNTIPGDYAISLLQLFDRPDPEDEPMLVRDDSSSDEEGSIFEDDAKHPNRPKKVRVARKIERKFNKMKMAKKFIVRPATVPNFAFGLANPMKRVKFLQLIDAGMDFCIPFPPLLREERNVKVVIILDMSAPPDCVEGNSLQAAIKWARNHGYYVPDAPYDCVKETENIFVFLSDHVLAPTLIYIPLRHNPEYGDFDPVENYAEGGYCSTSCLKMDADQIAELSGLFRCTMQTVDEQIKRAIYDTLSKVNNYSSSL